MAALAIHAFESDVLCPVWCRAVQSHIEATVFREGGARATEHCVGRPDVPLVCVANVMKSMHDAWLDLITWPFRS